jgi:hypothetical protein
MYYSQRLEVTYGQEEINVLQSKIRGDVWSRGDKCIINIVIHTNECT